MPPCGFAIVLAIPYCTSGLDSLIYKIYLALTLSYFCVTSGSPGTMFCLSLARVQKPTCLDELHSCSLQDRNGPTQGKVTMGHSPGSSSLASLASFQTLLPPPDLGTLFCLKREGALVALHLYHPPPPPPVYSLVSTHTGPFSFLWLSKSKSQDCLVLFFAVPSLSADM